MVRPSHASTISQLLEEHSAKLTLFARQWSDSPEDVVQESFIELARQVEIPNQPLAWLYRAVRNRAINSLRSKQRREHHERIAAELFDQRSAAKLDDIERLVLFECFEQLSAEERELIVLRVWSGLKWSEVASVTNTSTSSAQRNYVAALQTLKSYLEPKWKNQKT